MSESLNSRVPERRLAILMTCHNRAPSTVRSINALKSQTSTAVLLDLVVVDDGSSDGTAQDVARVFPGAHIILGDGTLYWSGGMHRAFDIAMRQDYDFYLWLNDDTDLDSDALAKLIAAYEGASSSLGEAVIVVGSTRDPESGAFSYGGWRRHHRAVGMPTWRKCPPDPLRPILCDTMNGNCVLIPRSVAKRVGNLDPVFRQSFGDLDYGLRAVQLGCQILVAPGYCGKCTDNDGSGMWTDGTVPLFDRWRKLLGPKGLPFKAWGTFTRRHKGRFWLLSWLAPYILFWLKAPFPRG